MIHKNTIIFAGPEHPETIQCAKDYIKDMDFSCLDVKIVKRGHLIIIEALRDIPNPPTYMQEEKSI